MTGEQNHLPVVDIAQTTVHDSLQDGMRRTPRVSSRTAPTRQDADSGEPFSRCASSFMLLSGIVVFGILELLRPTDAKYRRMRQRTCR